jgi:hypothetical protein
MHARYPLFLLAGWYSLDTAASTKPTATTVSQIVNWHSDHNSVGRSSPAPQHMRVKNHLCILSFELSQRCFPRHTFAWAITELRIVEGNLFDAHCEYLVVAAENDKLVASWKRCKDFAALAEEAATRGPAMHQTCMIWEEILASRRKHMFRNLNLDYLKAKSMLLSRFLKQYCFEAAVPGELRSFFEAHGAVDCSSS